jgi:hypothetical protein
MRAVDLRPGDLVRRSAARPRHLQRVITLLERFTTTGSLISTTTLDVLIHGLVEPARLLVRIKPCDFFVVRPTQSFCAHRNRYGADVVEAAVVELGEHGSLSLPALRRAVQQVGIELIRRNRNQRADRRLVKGGGE